MTDEQAIGAVIDEMYAMISGPAGPRDWSCFLLQARLVEHHHEPRHSSR